MGAAYGISLDFQQAQSSIGVITIQNKSDSSEQPSVMVPFYLEKDRTTRMPVIDCVELETSQKNVEMSVELFGVYVHLNGR